ncbi:hypothetical protein B0H19DRAFT_433686 [Mycena capillaripes]|nr:hypothetical protein B0H19DRAFT_433686 [Mycena capillaripes]
MDGSSTNEWSSATSESSGPARDARARILQIQAPPPSVSRSSGAARAHVSDPTISAPPDPTVTDRTPNACGAALLHPRCLHISILGTLAMRRG